MPYTPVTFVDGVTPLNAANMNKLEDGVEAVTPLAEGAIPKALVDAKGDILVATANDTPTRLPLGTNGQALLVDTSTATGLKYGVAGAALTYEGDHVPATTYDDGDVVVKDGIAYLCVGGPTTEAPSIAPWGQAALNIAGDEMAYAEATAPLSAVTVTTEATAVTFITLSAITVDGATPILLDFYTPHSVPPGAPGATIFYVLYDGATNLGSMGQHSNPAANAYGVPLRLSRKLIPAAGSHTYSVRVYVSSGTGQVYGGLGAAGGLAPANFRIARVVPSPPQFGAGALTPVTYGITLPASPADGQEAILVDSLTAPTYQWRFRYNAGSSSAYKWEFVGGSPLIAAIPAGENTASVGSWLNLTTPGPLFTVPRAGEYAFAYGAVEQNTTVVAQSTGLAIGDTTPFSAVTVSIPGANYSVPVSTEGTRAAAAGDILKVRYLNNSGGTGTWQARWLRLTPVRVA